MVQIVQKVELSGPFFTRDPGKTLRANIRDMLDALAAEMERTARAGIAPHSDTGWTHDHTIGYTTSAKTGKRWGLWAAVGLPTTGMDKKAAIRTKAAAAGRRKAVGSDGRDRGTAKGIEERFHPFRNTKSAVYRARAIITADLTEGLN